MKKAVSLTMTAVFFLVCAQAFGQTYRFYQTENIHNQLRLNTTTGEVLQIQDDGLSLLVHPPTTSGSSERYSLHKTQNMWTYILLDEFTGRLWQCQYSVDGPEYTGSWEINPYVLSKSNRRKFTIQPLTSMYQYYLINQETGEMWKFQWTTQGSEYRWIEPM